jgi:hypothetical protein
MGKTAVLFLLIGLVVGLWLGFNPAAHRQVLRWWDQAQQGQKVSTLPGQSNTPQLSRRASRLPQLSLQLQPAAKTGPSIVPTGAQISTELKALWNGLLSIWQQLLARFSGAR